MHNGTWTKAMPKNFAKKNSKTRKQAFESTQKGMRRNSFDISIFKDLFGVVEPHDWALWNGLVRKILNYSMRND